MSATNDTLSRRNLLGGAAVIAAGLGGLDARGASHRVAAPAVKKRSVRFAHFTDIHLEPKRNAPAGLTAALRHVHALGDKPDLLITGGDSVMDVLGADENWANIQFSLLKDLFAKECSLPVKWCVGNHDVWGWDKKNSKTTGDEPRWGKQRPVQEYNLSNRYYAFNQGSWRIIMLDSVYPSPDVYTARLDDEQFAWLADELKTNSDKHICIVSHIPILSAAVFLDGENEKSGRWVLPHQWMLLDARRIVELFVQHPNVKLCISGHLHLLERVNYNNVAYICDGAVCAGWWGGPFHQCQEGYGLFDLYDDGTFDHVYADYGWEVQKEK